MKFREWIDTTVSVNDIICDCTDPGENDADNPIYPLGCHPDFGKFREMNKTDIFTNNPSVNTELLFYSYRIKTDLTRRGFKTSSIYDLGQPTMGFRDYYRSILDKTYTMTQLPPSEYFSNLGKYKFVISPEGNGIDCYRHYETWLSKGIPIIEYNSFIEKKYSTLPILWTRDYSEINDNYLNSIYPKFLDKNYDFRRLLLTKYNPRIQYEITNVCNNHSNTIQTNKRRSIDRPFWKYSDYFKN